MAKALKCDRCGIFYDLTADLRKYRIQEAVGHEKYVDLCPDCYNKFCYFLEEIKNHDLIVSGELYPGEFDFEEGPK